MKTFKVSVSNTDIYIEVEAANFTIVDGILIFRNENLQFITAFNKDNWKSVVEKK